MKTRFTANKLAALSNRELYTLARELDIEGRAGLSRSELLKMLQLLLVEPPASRSLKKANDIGVPPENSELIKLVASDTPVNTQTPASAKNAEELPLVERPRRGRPPKARVEAEPVVEKPRRGRPPKARVETEPVVERPRRGRPPKARVEAEPVVEKPRRGRPPKARVEAEPVVEKSRRGRPPKARVEAEPVVEKPRRGRPPKSRENFVSASDSPLQPAKLSDNQSVYFAQKPSSERIARECEEEAAALKRLSRAFGKRSDELPAHEKRKGAEVLEPAVAIPFSIHNGNDEKKVSNRAEQIESERRRKHASLKTTMEIPIFSTQAYGLTAPVSEDELTGELPEYYDETRIVMQIRDPHWAYTYWELPPVERKRLELEVGIFEFAHSHFVLKLHNVSRGHTQEIKLTENARNWYLYLEDAQCVYQVELGLQSPTEGYSFIALSNLVQTPPDKVAEVWAAPVSPEPVPEAQPSRLPHSTELPTDDSEQVEPPTAFLTDPVLVYAHSPEGRPLARSGSSELLTGVEKPLSAMPGSQTPIIPPGDSSFNLPGSLYLQMPVSPSGPAGMPGSASLPSSDTFSSLNLVSGQPDEIGLVLAADLLIYGSVSPGSQVFFMGQQLKVRQDGSFTLRLAMPVDSARQLELTVVDPVSGREQVVKARFVFAKE